MRPSKTSDKTGVGTQDRGTGRAGSRKAEPGGLAESSERPRVGDEEAWGHMDWGADRSCGQAGGTDGATKGRAEAEG